MESSCRSSEKSRGERHRVVLERIVAVEYAVRMQRAGWVVVVVVAATGVVVVDEARAWTWDERCRCHLLQSAVKTVCGGLQDRLDQVVVRSVALPPGRGSRHLDLHLP